MRPKYLWLIAAIPFLVQPAAAAEREVPPLQKGERIVFLGDSITAGGVRPNGYVTLIKTHVAEKHKELGIEVIGAGISGNKVPDLQRRLEKDVLAKKPTLVVIYIGINDVWHGEKDPARGTPKDKFEAGLKEIIGKIKDAGARVVLCTPSVIGEKKGGANPLDAKLDEYAETSRKVARDTGSLLCDLRKAFVDHLAKQNADNAERGILTGDRVHLNDAGNRLVAETILAVIDPADPKAPPKKGPKAPDKPVGIPPTKENVAYGEHPRQVLDFYQAQSEAPTPVVFAIHGGGWVNGDKSGYRGAAKRFLDAGISVVAINYRFVTEAAEKGIEPPVKWPIDDAARALQFVRSKAKDWKLDKTRIGATGGSAGGCSSLWLAFHDDLADPKSEDPIARESTRLYCAAVSGPQTTLDPKVLREWMPNARYGGHAFGVRTPKERDGAFQLYFEQREKLLPWIIKYSPISHVSKDDPAVFMEFPNQKKPPVKGETQDDPTHSALLGLILMEKLKESGVEGIIVYPDHPHDKYKNASDFLIDRLTTARAGK